MEDGLAVARQPRRAVEQPAGAHRLPRRRAEVGQLAQALLAAPARRQPREQDGRAGGEVDAAPTASTTPAPSWPRTAGQRVAAVPSIALRSEWQTPAARRRTSTSPGPGGASSSSTSSSDAPVCSRTAARILRARPAAARAGLGLRRRAIVSRPAGRSSAARAALRASGGSASGGRARPRAAAAPRSRRRRR